MAGSFRRQNGGNGKRPCRCLRRKHLRRRPSESPRRCRWDCDPPWLRHSEKPSSQASESPRRCRWDCDAMAAWRGSDDPSKARNRPDAVGGIATPVRRRWPSTHNCPRNCPDAVGGIATAEGDLGVLERRHRSESPRRPHPWPLSRERERGIGGCLLGGGLGTAERQLGSWRHRRLGRQGGRPRHGADFSRTRGWGRPSPACGRGNEGEGRSRWAWPSRLPFTGLNHGWPRMTRISRKVGRNCPSYPCAPRHPWPSVIQTVQLGRLRNRPNPVAPPWDRQTPARLRAPSKNRPTRRSAATR
jgi:hypothetical protein